MPLPDEFFNRRSIQRTSYGLASLWEKVSKVRFMGTFLVWGHLAAVACRSLARSPMSSLLSIFCVGLALSLFGAFLLLFEHAGSYVGDSKTRISLSLYFKENTQRNQINELNEKLKTRVDVQSVRLIPKEEALKDLEKNLGPEAALVAGLEQENPLPDAVEIKVKDGSEKGLNALAKEFEKDPLVQEVHYNRNLAGQLQELIGAVRHIGILGAGAIFLLCAFLISSTLKLALNACREEIAIMGLVGADDSFVRVPFVLEGAIKGVLGALLGLAVLQGMLAFLNSVWTQFEFLKLFTPQLHFLSLGSCCLLIFSGLLIGVVSSWFTVRKLQIE